MTTSNKTAAALEWNSIVSAEAAAKLLGYRNIQALATDRALGPVDRVSASCRAAGAWRANEREGYVAWRSLAAAL